MIKLKNLIIDISTNKYAFKRSFGIVKPEENAMYWVKYPDSDTYKITLGVLNETQEFIQTEGFVINIEINKNEIK